MLYMSGQQKTIHHTICQQKTTQQNIARHVRSEANMTEVKNMSFGTKALLVVVDDDELEDEDVVVTATQVSGVLFSKPELQPQVSVLLSKEHVLSAFGSTQALQSNVHMVRSLASLA
eukprot:Lankesteria_metandrocarpae@DN5432_c1_g1_i18.p1